MNDPVHQQKSDTESPTWSKISILWNVDEEWGDLIEKF